MQKGQATQKMVNEYDDVCVSVCVCMICELVSLLYFQKFPVTFNGSAPFIKEADGVCRVRKVGPSILFDRGPV